MRWDCRQTSAPKACARARPFSSRSFSSRGGAFWARLMPPNRARRGGDERRLLPPAAARDAARLRTQDPARLGEEISACNPIIYTLCDHVQNVVANTEDVAVNILTQLKRVDDKITGLITFLRVVSRDKILPIVEQTEMRLHVNNQTLSDFLANRMAAMEKSRASSSPSPILPTGRTPSSRAFESWRGKPICSRSTPALKPRGQEGWQGLCCRRRRG